MEKLMNRFFLFMARNKWLNKLAKKYGFRYGAGRFVAGVDLDNAVTVIQALNQQGMRVTIDHLGEFVTEEGSAHFATLQCLEVLEALHKHQLNANLSLKLTSLGLDISYNLCLKNMREVIHAAERQGNQFLRIDMEDYAHLEQTMTLFHRLRKEYPHIGLVIQAYLYRSEEDLKQLGQQKTNLRLVKGAYKESSEVAFPSKRDVDQNFKKLISLQLQQVAFAAVATHDEVIINYTKSYIKQHNIDQNQFEFQMLYGIRTDLQQRLVEEGYPLRIYVPYGQDWYGYFMRRLAERPANVAFVLKGILKRDPTHLNAWFSRAKK